MSVNKVIACGLAGNEISKQITGTSDVTTGRTAVATGSGAVLGVIIAGTTIGVGIASSPVTVPIALGSGLVAGIASLYD